MKLLLRLPSGVLYEAANLDFVGVEVGAKKMSHIARKLEVYLTVGVSDFNNSF